MHWRGQVAAARRANSAACSPSLAFALSIGLYLTGRDALNSVRQETDAAGQVLAARSFDPSGVPLSGDGEAPFGYAGEYSDD